MVETGLHACLSLGFPNTIPQIGSSNNANVFLRLPRLTSPRSRCHRVRFWLELLSWLQIPAFLLCPHVVGKETGISLHFLSKIYLFIFRERGRMEEREGGKHQCLVSSHVLPTGDLAYNTGMCPAWELNWQPFALQSNWTGNPLLCSPQSTEPDQPGFSSSSYKATMCWIRASHLLPHLILITSKDPTPDTNHSRGLKTSTHEFEGNAVQSLFTPFAV